MRNKSLKFKTIAGMVGLSALMASTSAIAQTDVRFAAFGDYGEDSSRSLAVSQTVDSFNPDFILALGDLRYGSRTFDTTTGKIYCQYLKDAQSGSNCSGDVATQNRFFAAPGNHEYTDGGGINEYLNYFTLPGVGIATSNTSGSERYYDAIVGPVHIFALDSQSITNNGGPNSPDALAQKAWLQSALAASTSPWKVVIVHHPPYSSSSAHGSDPDMQLPYAAWGADVVFAGHDHMYERISRDGIPYFVSGFGGRSAYNFGSPIAGSEVRYNAVNGTMIVDATATSMNFRFFNTSNTEIDNYTITNTPPVNNPPTANFSFNCTDLDCSFDGGASSDTDGSILSYAWDYDGDGNDSGVTAAHSFTSAGTYSVSLTVTDDDGDNDTIAQNISVTEPPVSNISVSFDRSGRRNNKLDILWTGATTSKIDLYKNGSLYRRTRNDGKYTDKNVSSGVTYTYRVCDRNSSTACSPTESFTF